jgi:hypothetical protein
VTERELTAPVDLCAADGSLARDAIGWSRVPLHRCNLRGRWGRTKRWNHWCIDSRDATFIVTVADLDYLAMLSVLFRDHRTGVIHEHALPVPGGFGVRLGETVADPVEVRLPTVRVTMTDSATAMSLRVSARTFHGVIVEAAIDIEPARESLNVVIPWSAHTFQFTSKHQARAAHGTVTIDGEPIVFDALNRAFACLDFGRGVWPYRTAWNWGAGAGVHDGRTIGLNLGGQWTDGTGFTENGVWLDGRVHKIDDDVRFEFDRAEPLRPWRIHTVRSPRLALTYTPRAKKRIAVNLGVAASVLDVTWGTFDGSFVADDGTMVGLREISGWAEDHRARW